MAITVQPKSETIDADRVQCGRRIRALVQDLNTEFARAAGLALLITIHESKIETLGFEKPVRVLTVSILVEAESDERPHV